MKAKQICARQQNWWDSLLITSSSSSSNEAAAKMELIILHVEVRKTPIKPDVNKHTTPTDSSHSTHTQIHYCPVEKVHPKINFHKP